MKSKIIGPEQIALAARRLAEGDVVGFPTETVYGLAASMDQNPAVRKIFALKERPFFDPLIVHVHDFKQAQECVERIPAPAEHLARHFWPGPLTMVLRKRSHVDPLITSGLETVGLRSPAHPLALALLKESGPLAAPSANKFGKTSPTTAEHVLAEFPDAGILILDGGPCRVGIESTVVSVTDSGLTVHRPGAVTLEMMKSVLKDAFPELTYERMVSQASPGHVEHHYCPAIPLVLVRGEANAWSGDRVATEAGRALGQELKTVYFLDLSQGPAWAARVLYSEMRKGVERGADFLAVRWEKFMCDGLWEAVEDRVTRASSLVLQ